MGFHPGPDLLVKGSVPKAYQDGKVAAGGITGNQVKVPIIIEVPRSEAGGSFSDGVMNRGIKELGGRRPVSITLAANKRRDHHHP